MEKFLKRKEIPERPSGQCSQAKQARIEVDLETVPFDPGLRQRITDYHPDDQDKIRRKYLQMGPHQPRNHTFPQRRIGDVLRRFNPSWYDKYGNWLEYSVSKDAVYCLPCYLFRKDKAKQGVGDSFITEGFNAWNKKDRFDTHVGGPNSAHNQSVKRGEDLMNQNQHIQSVFIKQSNQAKIEYRTRLTASVDCLRFLLKQGLAFRGHDESDDSSNQGNFLEVLHFLADHCESIKSVVLKNAPTNLKLTSHDIQSDIISAAAIETTNAIITELGDGYFAILVDESRDISNKEQMAIVLRFLNKKGCVVERFLGIAHVSETTALALKKEIESMLSKYGLSLSRLRGQGYDGASNIATLFCNVTCLINVVGASCKRHDSLKESQATMVIEGLINGELTSGRGLNQETSLKRAGDTRWGSHYGTLLSIIILFSPIIKVLENVIEDGLNSTQRAEAEMLLGRMESFDFVFNLHLMRNVLGITNELSKALQRDDQDIVNAMELVKVSKQRLQMMRDNGWNDLLDEVNLFCQKLEIECPCMNNIFVPLGRSSRRASGVFNLYHYKVELFYVVIDRQLQELNNRFDEINTELLLCVACLNPSNSFSSFDKKRLIQMAQLYSLDFSAVNLMELDNQLQTYIIDMQSNSEFSSIKSVGEHAKKLVETKKDIVYPLVFKLVKFALILPVATASVERSFSAMKILKNRLRNRMGIV